MRRQSKEKKKTVAKKMSQKRSQKSHPRRRRAGKGAVSPTCKATIGKRVVYLKCRIYMLYLECI